MLVSPATYTGPTGSAADKFCSFVGNFVNGGRQGALLYPPAGQAAIKLSFCGNAVSLLPAFDRSDDWPGAPVTAGFPSPPPTALALPARPASASPNGQPLPRAGISTPGPPCRRSASRTANFTEAG